MSLLSDAVGFQVWDARSDLPHNPYGADRALSYGLTTEIFLGRGLLVGEPLGPWIEIRTLNPHGLTQISEPGRGALYERLNTAQVLRHQNRMITFDLLKLALRTVATPHRQLSGYSGVDFEGMSNSSKAAPGEPITLTVDGAKVSALAIQLGAQIWAVGSCDIACPVSVAIWRQDLPDLKVVGDDWQLPLRWGGRRVAY